MKKDPNYKQSSFEDLFDDFFQEEMLLDFVDKHVVPHPKIEEPEFILMDKANILKTSPILLDEQADDVVKAEKRFFKNNAKGILFTNATGTGKTFTGLGIVKRFMVMQKDQILIVVPTDRKCKDWIEDALNFDLEIKQIENVEECHDGINITTYANFYQNQSISNHNWNLVIYDESHYLQQNAKGDFTVYQKQHQIVCKLPSTIRSILRSDENIDDTLTKSEEEIQQIIDDYVDSTKVVFLSATPFAYIKSLIYGDGTLWDIYEVKNFKGTQEVYGYNQPDPMQSFYVENFGYRMMYGKLTIPDNAVDMNVMERNFHEKYKKLGVISGRQLIMDKDYSRDFIALTSDLGNKIDEGKQVFSTNDFRDRYPVLNQVWDSKYKGLYNRQLLEAIKVRLVIYRIKEHIKLGRKVVVFHDYNNAIPSHPFRFTVEELLSKSILEKFDTSRLQYDIDEFHKNNPHLYNLDLSELKNAISEYSKVFEGEIAIFNGTIAKGKRSLNFKEFMSDHSHVNLILIQRKAGKEGISAHDKTAFKGRVLIDLGLPTSPTDAIQCEGRIYRYGVMSNSRIEYPVIQTSFERETFAFTIATRSRTAENLALGNLARNMESVFKDGYSNAEYLSPSETTGTGGKENDKFEMNISEFDMAKSFYFSNQRKNSRNRSQEGVDYFATPEPLGFKMVEWLKLKPGLKVLEPSCGHGAISRFLPWDTNNVMIEPSNILASKAMINSHGDVINKTFEEYHIINSFNRIVMNPPFGRGGSLAASHLEKCLANHLYRMLEDTMLIIIAPNSPIYDKAVEDMFYRQSTIRNNFSLSREIYLPNCTFERAGTQVNCKIQFYEKVKNSWDRIPPHFVDLRHCSNIKQFFREIENLNF